MTASVQQKKPKLRPGHVASLQALALAAGVARRTVGEWAHLEGFPREPDGTFSVWKVAQWNAGRVEPQRQSNGARRLNRLRGEKLAIENAERMIKLRQRAGELISRVAVEKFLHQFVHSIRSRLLAIPAESTSAVPPDSRAEVTADMEHGVGLVLRELGGLKDRLAAEIDDGGS